MALVAFHFYAMAIEAAARVDLGEMHAATLVATTALGAVENLQGCEYGLEIRVALRRRPQARRLAAGAERPPARGRLRAAPCMNNVRDPRLRRLFTQRPMNAALFETTPVPSVPSNGRGPPRRRSRPARERPRPHDDDSTAKQRQAPRRR